MSVPSRQVKVINEVLLFILNSDIKHNASDSLVCKNFNISVCEWEFQTPIEESDLE